jgi:hypothetical protein
MKYLFFLFLAIARLSSAIELDDIGIRLLLNQGQAVSEHIACTQSEKQAIQKALEETLPNQRFRPRNQLSACTDLCAGLDNCYLVHPKCRGIRIHSEETEIAVTDTQLTFGDTILKGDNMNFCEIKRQEAKSVLIQNLSSILSKQCNALARNSLLLECVYFAPHS